MRKIISVIIITAGLITAQNKELEQSIELPDFVITGVQSIDVPSIIKKKAELVPVVGKAFLTPRFESENLSLGRVDAPFYSSPKVFDEFNPLNFSLALAGGLYTLPSGEFIASKYFRNTVLSANLKGKNIRDYDDNSGSLFYGGELQARIYNDYKSSFLPGISVGFKGGYENHAYKFFASQTPELERKRQSANAEINIDYNRDKLINFYLTSYGDYTWLEENATSSLFLNNIAGIKLIMPTFDVNLNSKFVSTVYKDDFVSEISDSYVGIDAGVLFKLSDKIMVGGGLHYSSQDTNSFIFPNAALILKVNDYITLTAEAGGYAEYFSYNQLVRQNRYFKPLSMYSAYTENNLKVQFSLKYEFEQYFQITGGIGYNDYNDYYYFADNTNTGFFDIYPVQDVNKIFIFGKGYFHAGPMGSFYGGVKFQQFTFDDDNKLPYQPMLSSDLAYNYKTGFGLSFGVSFAMFFDTYIDKTNSSKLENFHELGLQFSYEVMKNMTLNINLQNILNKDNFRWNGYNEKPFDAFFGFNYKW